MRKDSIDIILKNKNVVFQNKRIEKIELVNSQEYKLSWIHRLKVNTGDFVIAKEFKRPRFAGLEIRDAAKKEYDNLMLLNRLFAGQEEFRVAKPLGFLESENILLLEEINARKTSEIIKKDLHIFLSRRGLKNIEMVFVRIGRWLRFFQEKTRQQDKEEFNKEGMRKDINKKVSVCQEFGLSAALIELVEKCQENILKRTGPQLLTKVFRHGDFTPWNVYADLKFVTVLDFSETTYGFSFDDLTVFLVSLYGYRNYLRVSKSGIDKLTRAFLKGYGEGEKNLDLRNYFILRSILEILSWAKEIYPRHAWHRFQKRCYIKFYKKLLKKFCLSILRDEPRLFI